MKLGEIEFYILNDGTFRLDGGAMFGVIPQTNVGTRGRLPTREIASRCP